MKGTLSVPSARQFKFVIAIMEMIFYFITIPATPAVHLYLTTQ